MQRLGNILVKQNFISSTDLEEALRIQVTQIVYRLFRWREGKYRFVPMDLMEYDNEYFQPLSAETILMEGARMIDEWPMLERRIKSSELVFRKTASGAALDVPIASLLDADIDFGFQDTPGRDEQNENEIRISPEERDVLRLVDGCATVQDIVDTSALTVHELRAALQDVRLVGGQLLPVLAVAAPHLPDAGDPHAVEVATRHRGVPLEVPVEGPVLEGPGQLVVGTGGGVGGGGGEPEPRAGLGGGRGLGSRGQSLGLVEAEEVLQGRIGGIRVDERVGGRVGGEDACQPAKSVVRDFDAKPRAGGVEGRQRVAGG